MITEEQKNKNILARFETSGLADNSKIHVGLIDGKKVLMISPETKEQAIESFKSKFGAERFGGLV